MMHPNPNTSDQDPSPIVPVVYEDDEYHLEYKYIRQDLTEEDPMDEKKLNKLSEKGWELISVFSENNIAHYYFKRLVTQ